MANTIITKNSATASAVPTSGDLVQGELAVNVTDKRLFTENSSGTVVELGTNPSTMAVAGNATVGGTLGVTGLATLASSTLTANPTLTSGTANGVTYLNGSKVLTSGSALTFDGTNFFGGTNTYVTGRFYAQRSSSSLNLPIAGYTDGSAGAVLTGTKGDIVAFGNSGGDGVIFANANTEQMRLTSTGLEAKGKLAVGYSDFSGLPANGAAFAGSVGIGTSLPFAKLQVVAASADYFNPQLMIGEASNSTGKQLHVGYNTTANTGYIQAVHNGTGYKDLLLQPNGGNLGLGVAPSTWFSSRKAISIYTSASFVGVSDGGAEIWGNAYLNAAGNSIYVQSAGAALYQVNRGANGSHAWLTAPSGTAGDPITFNQAMTLDASGNLGLGMTSMSRRLQIQTATTGTVDAISWTDGATDTGYLGIVGGGGVRLWAGGFLAFGSGGGASYTERARITSDGSLLVGTTSASLTGVGGYWEQSGRINLGKTGSSTYMGFYVNGTAVGSIATDGSITSYNTSSDYRLKEDWQPMTGASERVKALKPVNFAWKVNGERVDGFLAHEVQAVVPKAVTGEKDAVDDEGKPVYQGIDQSKLVPLLTAALQEALAKIESLEARLDAANL